MVRFVKTTLEKTIPFEAGAIKDLALPRQGYITHLDAILRLKVSTGADGGTPKTDGLWRVLKWLRIEGPAAKTYYAFRDGRIQKFKQILEYSGNFHEDPLPTEASVTKEVRAHIRIHTGFNPLDNFDPTVPIPAVDLNSLSLSVLWGDASDLGSGYTIDEGELKLTMYQILFDSEEEKRDWYPEGPAEPRYEAVEKSIDEVKTNLGFDFDLPTGYVLVKTLVMVVSSGDDYSDEEVTEYGVKFPKENMIPLRIDWRQGQYEDRARYSLLQTLAGRIVVDYEELTGNPLGIDMSDKQTGDVKLGFTTAKTGGKVSLMHVQVT